MGPSYSQGSFWEGAWRVRARRDVTEEAEVTVTQGNRPRNAGSL